MPPPEPSLDPPYRLDTEAGIDGFLVARVAGDLDYLGTPMLRRRLLDHVDGGVGVLVLDLSEVTLLSAAAMEMLLAVDVLARAHGCELRVVATTRAVCRPLTLTGLVERLRIFDSVIAARAGR